MGKTTVGSPLKETHLEGHLSPESLSELNSESFHLKTFLLLKRSISLLTAGNNNSSCKVRRFYEGGFCLPLTNREVGLWVPNFYSCLPNKTLRILLGVGRQEKERNRAGTIKRVYSYTQEPIMPSQRKLSCSPAFPEKLLSSQSGISVLLLLQPLLMIFISNNAANHTALLSIPALQMGETTDSKNLLH